MKRFGLIVMTAGCSLLSQAQTNPPDRLQTERGPTTISADSADFDLTGHEAIYHGHVRVDDPQMKLACEQLIANMPAAGGRVNHIVAETNVVIDFVDNKGQTNHMTSEKAVYVYHVENGLTNETVTLTGPPQPQMENAQGKQSGDVIIWNRVNTNTSARIIGNYKVVARQHLNGTAETTNPPPFQTRSGAAAKSTNVSPDAVENTNPPAVPPEQP